MVLWLPEGMFVYGHDGNAMVWINKAIVVPRDLENRHFLVWSLPFGVLIIWNPHQNTPNTQFLLLADFFLWNPFWQVNMALERPRKSRFVFSFLSANELELGEVAVFSKQRTCLLTTLYWQKSGMTLEVCLKMMMTQRQNTWGPSKGRTGLPEAMPWRKGLQAFWSESKPMFLIENTFFLDEHPFIALFFFVKTRVTGWTDPSGGRKAWARDASGPGWRSESCWNGTRLSSNFLSLVSRPDSGHRQRDWSWVALHHNIDWAETKWNNSSRIIIIIGLIQPNFLWFEICS